MAVMAAGMHFSIPLRFEIKGIRLLHGQPVDVCPERDRLARFPALDAGHKTGILFRIDFIGNAQLVQLCGDPLRGLLLFIRQLRILMEGPSQSAYIVFILRHQFFNGHL